MRYLHHKMLPQYQVKLNDKNVTTASLKTELRSCSLSMVNGTSNFYHAIGANLDGAAYYLYNIEVTGRLLQTTE